MNMKYESDDGDIRAVARNLARFVIVHYTLLVGKFVTLRYIREKVRAEVPTAHSIFSDLTRFGTAASKQYMCLRPEQVRAPGEPFAHSAVFFDDVLLDRCQAWLQRSSDEHPVIIDIP